MEKSTETKGKIHSSEAESIALRLLEFIEAEMSKGSPDMAAKIQKIPVELRLKLLLLAALEVSRPRDFRPKSTSFDWGGLA